MSSSRYVGALLMLGFLLFQPACNDSETDLVTISGHVRNADTGQPVYGAVVSLLETNFRDTQATGTDGKYIIQVPKGSKLYLVTDDFDSRLDELFPMINADSPATTANEDIDGWPIHACPRTRCPADTLSSVSAWTEYLSKKDEANGDLFVPASPDSSGGVVALSMFACDGDSLVLNYSGYTFVSDTPAFPMGYFVCDGKSVCDPASPVLFPATRSTTDVCGVVFSFGDPSFTGKFIHVSVTDTDASRHTSFQDLEIPVRHGMTTLVLPSSIDGIGNRTFKDLAECAGLFPAGGGKPGMAVYGTRKF